MSENPLASLTSYSRFVAESLDRPDVTRSTVMVWSDSPFTGIAEGEVIFSTGIRLRMREELDFDAALRRATLETVEAIRKCIEEEWLPEPTPVRPI